MIRALKIIIEQPKKVLLGSTLLFTFLLSGLMHLSSDYGVKFWFLANDPLIKELDRAEQLFGGEDKILVALELNSTELNQDVMDALTRAQLILENTLDVYSSQGLANYPLIIQEDNESIITDYQSSSKAELIESLNQESLAPFYSKPNVAMVLLTLKPEFQSNNRNYQLIKQDLDQNIKQILEQESLIKHISASGSPLLTEAFRSSSTRDILVLLPFVGALIFFTLYWYFGSLITAMLPLVLFTFTSAATFGVAGFLGMPIHSISSIIPTILLTIGLADSQHLFSCSPEHIRHSLKDNFYPTLFTTLTTAVGFLSFGLSDLVPLSQMGLLTGLGVCLAWLATYTLLAPLVVLYPKFFLSAQFKNNKPFLFKNIKTKFVLITAALVLLPSLWGLTQLTIQTNPYQYFSKQTWFQQDYQKIIHSIGATPGPEILIDSMSAGGVKDPVFMQKLEAFHQELLKRESIRYLRSPVTELERISRGFFEAESISLSSARIAELLLLAELMLPAGFSLNEIIDQQQRSVRFSLFWTIEDSSRANQEVLEILTLAQTLGLEAKATGRLYLYYRMTDYLVSSFLQSFLMAIAMVSVLIFLLFKRPDYALLSLVPNLLPLIIGFGILPLVGLKLETTTVMVASMCYGLAVDDTIHLMWHYFHSNPTLSQMERIEQTRDKLWRPLASTSLILSLGMSLLGLSHFLPNARFGLLAAFILFISLLADLFLLPVLLRILPKAAK